ncbi:DUF2892 domain-containing protein [Rhodocyclus tenuis]|uniref:DUF2892 domain-containing protein n=2 Tax=Rhodocyclus TaxID=1064 RepID=A0A6L5JWN8_RHOTE|nr:DUF2892 domain-containing protein [Rhodocyclus gracilis]MQY51496.1 DUF2892 domain-containing protein [Rhodocyclus gracilis]MRD72238.1 DUF2892 domain-containing protein [Rhodocyclus gracilis]NJA89344.1 DUF2892 domain-containing protein [Rhodocyclus gracilis]
MNANVGGIDRSVRIVIGAALVGAAAAGIIGAWGWLGLLPLASGLFSRCPAYPLLGINTYRKR